MVEHIFSAERFAEGLDRYGPELEHWPVDLRAAAASWLVNHAEARRQHAAASDVADALRAAMQRQPLGAAAFGRLSHALEQRRARKFLPALRFQPRLMAAAAMLLMAVFAGGIWTGKNYAAGENGDDYITLASLDQSLMGDDDADAAAGDDGGDMNDFGEL
jgi:hypothetical protein